MKKLLLFIFLLFITRHLHAGNTQEISPALHSVTVYLGGATLTHTVKLNLQKGTNKIILTNLASGINERTVRISLHGEGEILTINKMLNHIRKNRLSANFQKLEQKLERLKKERQTLKGEIGITEKEIELLKALSQKTQSGNWHKIDATLKNFFDRAKTLSEKMVAKNLKAEELQKEIGKIKKQLKELNVRAGKPVNEIEIIIKANKKSKAELTLSYFTNAASWDVAYRIISEGFGKPLKLIMNASIKQTTGIIWQPTTFYVSTRQPFLNNNKPKLNPWYIDFSENNPPRYFLSTEQMAKAAPSTTVYHAQEKIKSLSIEYKLNSSFPIPPDGKKRLLAIKETTITPDYHYTAVPRLSQNAFLICKLKEWEKLHLLPGEVEIFYENSYVGKSYINPQSSEKHLTLSLGKDKSIFTKKKLIKDFKEKNFFGDKETRTFVYKTVLKNNGEKDIVLSVEDQIPVSKNEDIEVKVKEVSGGKLDVTTGIISWEIPLKAKEKRVITLSYSISYPKGKKIYGL